MTHVHLIGIGGAGLSAIARVLLERGDVVSGSDRQLSPSALALQAAGVRVHAGHEPANIQGAEIVLRSSAIPDSNVEVAAARAAGIPVLKRAEFLGSLTGQKRVIAVAGTHGKTTTTAMIAWMLARLGQDPTYIIGSVSNNLGSNAHAGSGPDFVIEADEYDRMFLGLSPDVAVVTNMEHDHPDCYPTPEDYAGVFAQFAARLRPGGLLLACGDDRGARGLLARPARLDAFVRSYGLNNWVGQPAGLYYAARDLKQGRVGYDFEFAVNGQNERSAAVSLQVLGAHNVANAAAALGVADWLGLPLADAAAAVSEFTGTERRFQVRGEVDGVLVVDDYAHHPTEIRSTLNGARAAFPQRRIWAVWQPHTFSRTRTLLKEFAEAFDDADFALVMEIYPSREQLPADGFSSRQVVDAMQHRGARYGGGIRESRAYLAGNVRPGDVVIVLSAGDADQVSTGLLDDLQQSRQQA